MRVNAIEHLNAVALPRDVTHDDLLTQLLRNPGKERPSGSLVGLPAPGSPEEQIRRSLGLDPGLVREALKPRSRKEIDVFHTKISDSLTEEASVIPDLDKVVRYYTSPKEIQRIRNNSPAVSKFTFPLR